MIQRACECPRLNSSENFPRKFILNFAETLMKMLDNSFLKLNVLLGEIWLQSNVHTAFLLRVARGVLHLTGFTLGLALVSAKK